MSWPDEGRTWEVAAWHVPMEFFGEASDAPASACGYGSRARLRQGRPLRPCSYNVPIPRGLLAATCPIVPIVDGRSLRPKELTLRGLVLGALITTIFTAANVYLGLKVGLTFASSIPAAVISMAILSAVTDSSIL